jgi:hypothetical protein
MFLSFEYRFAYKCGFICGKNFRDGANIVRVKVDKYAYLIEVKSIHAAKIMITKHFNKLKTAGIQGW